jgi:hypothetical protein
VRRDDEGRGPSASPYEITKTNDQGNPTTRKRSGPGSRPRWYPRLKLTRDEIYRAARFASATDSHFKSRTRAVFRCPCPDCVRWRESRVVA